jgi:hypothetical protein
MAIVALSQQVRILDAAARHLGPNGEALLRAAAVQATGSPFETLSYAQLDELLRFIARERLLTEDRAMAAALARDLLSLYDGRDQDLTRDLVIALEACLGISAEAFVANVRARIGRAGESLSAGDLPQFTALAGQLARDFLGAGPSDDLVRTIRTMRTVEDVCPYQDILRIAIGHAGESGEAGIRTICREHLEIDLEALTIEGIPHLARAVAVDAGRSFANQGAGVFMDAVRNALYAAGEALRARLAATVGRYVGPAREVLIRRVCARCQIPFDALTYEHIGPLAGALRDEASPYIGDTEAARLMEEIGALLTRAS